MRVPSKIRRWRAMGWQVGRSRVLILFSMSTCLLLLLAGNRPGKSRIAAQEPGNVPRGQSQEEADRKSTGCVSCHTSTDEPTMHPSKAVHIGCTDCHGGN